MGSRRLTTQQLFDFLQPDDADDVEEEDGSEEKVEVGNEDEIYGDSTFSFISSEMLQCLKSTTSFYFHLHLSFYSSRRYLRSSVCLFLWPHIYTVKETNLRQRDPDCLSEP